ncbi:hypothetical protein ACIQNU_21890 [Streptomyces sp. NPDC091292]|uniref:hypothetical protein n=1 Tax=Streptomyces sp. NPDC091292 TaxID=3365991 RepID=UPI0037F2168E
MDSDIWQPEPGETLLTRKYVCFATGAAIRVSGMRWFRDTERRDIQKDLPGWPEGPVYEARSTGNTVARGTVKGVFMAVGVAIMGALSSQGGSVGPGRDPRGSDKSQDRADEVEDFPVLWGAPGTVARTLPWQLDPARVDPKYYRTHAIVTDRRLVIVGLPYEKKRDENIEDEFLWEIPRSRILRTELKNFKDGSDVKLVFDDGSWCRLSALSRESFVQHLIYPEELLPLESLTPAQRETLDGFIEDMHQRGFDTGTPVVSRRACGHYMVKVPVPSRLTAPFGYSWHDLSLNADGTQLEFKDYHPEDY